MLSFNFNHIIQSLPISLSILSARVSSTSYLSHAISAAQPLIHHWYNTTSGLWDTTGWWNSANTLTTLGNLVFLDHSIKPEITDIFTNTFHHAQNTAPGFIGEFYDDESWWALAWINAYDLTNNTGYLSQAARLFTDLTTGWGTSTCGGMWWNKKNTEVNAITNALFLSVAAHLATRIPDRSSYYLSWAEKEYDWFLNSGLINAQHNINDGLDLHNCTNNNGTIWSYNQGVILGALVELNKLALPGSSSRIVLAKSVARAAITHLSSTHDATGVLRDVCDPTCDVTGAQFKGIFMRNLQRLQHASPDPEFARFIAANAHSIWTRDRDKTNNTLGDAWEGPFTDASASTQTSALDALIAAAAVLGR